MKGPTTKMRSPTRIFVLVCIFAFSSFHIFKFHGLVFDKNDGSDVDFASPIDTYSDNLRNSPKDDAPVLVEGEGKDHVEDQSTQLNLSTPENLTPVANLEMQAHHHSDTKSINLEIATNFTSGNAEGKTREKYTKSTNVTNSSNITTEDTTDAFAKNASDAPKSSVTSAPIPSVISASSASNGTSLDANQTLNETTYVSELSNTTKSNDTGSSPMSNSSVPETSQKTDGTPRDGASPPLNIIVFFPDDMSHKSLQDVSGTDHVQTPFLSELAREGIRFTKNAVTTSICWMSRATLFTGLYASSHGSHRLYCPRFTLPQYWKDTWVSILQSMGGYHVGHVGKWQFHGHRFHKLFNFSHFFEGKHSWGAGRKTVHACDFAVKKSLEFLRTRPKDRPFALTVAFYPPKAVGQSYDPGGQWMPKESVKQMYANKTYAQPFDYDKAFSNLPNYLSKRSPLLWRYMERWNSTEKYVEGMRNYHALVTQVDTACEKIVRELKDQGLYENTLIIFTSDNGLLLGSHGLAGKWIAYEDSIRVPLIVYDPRMPKEKRGTLDHSLSLNVDLASTILGAANIDPPSVMQGRDLADLYLMEKARLPVEKVPWRKEFLYQFPNSDILESYALVEEKYKYIFYPGYDGHQLFDLEEDPDELNDILGRNETKDTEERMRKRYLELVQEMESHVPDKQDWCQRGLDY